jgi:hypothetical protein
VEVLSQVQHVFGLVVLETLTGYATCSMAPGHGNLLSMFDQVIPELEEVRRGTESLPVENLDRLDSLDSFQCPLTMEVITDPVITANGQTY